MGRNFGPWYYYLYYLTNFLIPLPSCALGLACRRACYSFSDTKKSPPHITQCILSSYIFVFAAEGLLMGAY